MNVIRARHRERAAFILQAIVRFVLDRRASGLLLHVLRKAATLDHEAGNHTMKNQPIKESVIDIAQEVFDGDWCLIGKKLQGKLTKRRLKNHHFETLQNE